jgi:hypothetical protein
MENFAHVIAFVLLFTFTRPIDRSASLFIYDLMMLQLM